MKLDLKKLSDQVIVITGATSGIGLVTARMAARRGAKLVLAARNESALKKLREEADLSNGNAICVKADVGNVQDVRHVACKAIETFGRIDTWINNAGVSIYGRITEVPDDDHRRLFQTNYWGVVNGSKIAVDKMRETGGGALINVGSTLSDRAIPLQGHYCASKHAVKGFTDALRMEIEEAGLPISVTLIKPAAIDTPYKQHARNYMGVAPENPPPVYAPETVAEAILHCAEHPTRDVFVGGGAKAISMMGAYAPAMTDKAMELTMFAAQKGDGWNDRSREGLFRSNDDELEERGGYAGHVAESSLYTKAALHPVVTGAVTGAALAVSAGLLYSLFGTGGGQRQLEQEH